MPRETVWHLVVWATISGERVHIYPDTSLGISATFPHQDCNSEVHPERSWRLGKPCLEKPIAVFNRASWSGEPQLLDERLPWILQRLLSWIDAAASDSLFVGGDPLELPVLPGQSLFPLLAFKEGGAELADWMTRQATWGYASTSPLQGTNNTRFIKSFQQFNGEIIRSLEWSPSMQSRRQLSDIVWVVLPEIPVLYPWQSPSNWLELSQRLTADKISLEKILVEIGVAARQNPRKTLPKLLLLGFPISEHVGLPPARLHWFAVSYPPLASNATRRNGFRSCESNQRKWDAEIATSTLPLSWHRTANWAPDQLRTRGAAENEICTRRILLIGAGALGSAVAENLLRMGVCEMGILDYDWMMMGNLSRHTLSMTAIGHKKANALATHLNHCMPDAKVRPFDTLFPPNNVQIKQAVKSYDVIVDCTGNDDALDALASFDWEGEKLFVSLAMTWRAEGFFAYAASETSFPVVDAKTHFTESPSPEFNEADAQIEGIGCWHSVFPATADDVQLWAAVGSKFIRRVILNPGRHYEYFQQMPDGTIERKR